MPVEQFQEVLACIREFELDLLALAPDERLFSQRRAAIGCHLFLDAFNRAPARAQRARDVLIRYRQQVSLFHTQARVRVENDRLELLDNVYHGVGCGGSAGSWAEGGSSARTVPSLGMLCEFGEP